MSASAMRKAAAEICDGRAIFELIFMVGFSSQASLGLVAESMTA